MGYEPEVIYDFDPHKLPPELLRAMGLVVAASAQTEAVVQDLIGGILNIDNIQTRSLTVHMSAPLKDQIVRSLSELDAPSVAEIDLIDELLDGINSAYSKRNAVVHNAIARHPETGETFSYRETSRGSLQISLQPIRASEVEKDAALIYDAGMSLMRYMIARGLLPKVRERAIRASINRGEKARTKRRDLSV